MLYLTKNAVKIHNDNPIWFKQSHKTYNNFHLKCLTKIQGILLPPHELQHLDSKVLVKICEPNLSHTRSGSPILEKENLQ